ncbi:MAG TPA: cysteine-rich CWC family protein [Burkholderiales bacterium]|nr:cysteine-rich CWC family protein [Burkholderiales bacterium]
MQSNLPKPDRCARCDAPFRCGARNRDADCWCAALPPLAPVPGRACLCRSCLELELKERT